MFSAIVKLKVKAKESFLADIILDVWQETI